MKAIGRASILFSVALVLMGRLGAEPLYQVDSPDLTGQTLFDQTLNETGNVTVKPLLSSTATGDVDVLNQCLWSVTVELNSSQPTLKPGKMICVGPQQEVLETVPQGSIAAFGECTDSACTGWRVTGDSTIEMTLSAPLAFTLQPRNERQ